MKPSNRLKRHLALGLMALWFFLGLTSIHAQEDAEDIDVQLNLTTTQAEFLLGEPVSLLLQVTHPAGYSVFVPELDRWGDLRVREQSHLQMAEQADGSANTTQTILVSRFVVGEFATEPLTVTVRTGDGKVHTLFSPSLTLTVRSTITDPEMAVLADIRPQASLPEPLLTQQRLILGGVILVGLVAVMALLYWFFRSARQTKEAVEPVDLRQPHEVAFDELDRIERLALPQQNEFKAHYIALSDCLRDYLYRQYQVPALDMTTSEIKQALKQSTMPLETQRPLLRLLTEFDMGKFAEFTPTTVEAMALIEEARLLVEAGIEVDEQTV